MERSHDSLREEEKSTHHLLSPLPSITHKEDVPCQRRGCSLNFPLGDTSLVGVKNVLIPVSTLELLFQRFDMLQPQLGDLKTLMSSGSAACSVSTVLASGEAVIATEEINTRVSTLEKELTDNINASSEVQATNRLLLEDNKNLRNELQQTQRLIQEK
ncbi:hypothetical protein TSAR_014215 [Trichomalopsis sarcophagae]|uniref:Uncharacterized protein n=1 Tax=Trichomalopsis sarcophagae TaxID=543379 RepID=A0A232FL91_9HYME|nr:hypothetical protein TSAR_014215 [Trichomalopsis sarcophagae]